MVNLSYSSYDDVPEKNQISLVRDTWWIWSKHNQRLFSDRYWFSPQIICV